MILYNEIRQILVFSEIKRIAWLLLPLIIGTILEMTALGILMPVIYVIIKPAILNQYPILHPLLIITRRLSDNGLIMLTLLGLVIIYFVKTLFLTYLTSQQNKLLYNIKAGILSRLFQGYIQQSWIFYLQRNSAELINNLTQEVNLFVENVLLSAITLLTEGFIFLGFFIILVTIQPIGTLVVACLSSIMILVFQKNIKKQIVYKGKKRQYHDTLLLRALQEGLGAIKEAKLLGREEYFYNHFNAHNLNSSYLSQYLATINKLPRLWLEWFAVVSITILVLVMLKQGSKPALLLSTVALFSVAAFRLIPSLSRIIEAVQKLMYGLPIIHTLQKEFKELATVSPPGRKELMKCNKQIKINHLYYKYRTAKYDTLVDINLSIDVGSSIGFIGASGAGKSTLIDIILGLIKPDKGQVTVDSIDIQTNIRGWQDQIGFVPQVIFLTDSSLRSNIAFGIPKKMIDEKALNKAIKMAQLENFISTLPYGLDTKVGERGLRLSGGQRQRIGIARALYHNPKVLVLDESTNAIDSAVESEIMESIRALHGKKTVLIIAHRLSTVLSCDYIYKLENGKISDEGDFESVTKTKK